jgi:hypothetical protein
VSQPTGETAANNSEEDKENHASEAVAPPAHNGTETNGEAKQVYGIPLPRQCNVGISLSVDHSFFSFSLPGIFFLTFRFSLEMLLF